MVNIRSKIIEEILFPIGSIYQRNNFFNEYKQFKVMQWKNRDELERLQLKKLKFLLEQAYRTTRLYRDKFTENGLKQSDIKSLDDLRKLPLTTKDEYRNNFPDRCVNTTVSKKKWILNSTSGSTGVPFRFVQDRKYWGVQYALYFHGLIWGGVNPGDPYIKLWGTNMGDISSGVQKLFVRLFLRREKMSAFNMDNNVMDRYVRLIKLKKPKAIESYTSAVLNLVKYIRERGIKDINIKSVITSGETLTPEYRKIIEDSLNCEVLNRYACREVGLIAHECEEHSGLHVFMGSCIVEYIGDRLIITNLDNTLMPFIRYDIEDLGIEMNENCPCGREMQLIREIRGRKTELLYTPSGKQISLHYFTLLFEEYAEYVKRFRVVQRRKDLLIIHIEPTEYLKESVIEDIKENVYRFTKNEMKINVKIVDSIPLTKAGKRELLRNEVYVR